MDNKDDISSKAPKPTLAEIERRNEELFQQFLFLVWQPNPARENVKVRLDNGEISFTLRDEKFRQLVESTLLADGCSKEVYDNVRRIELSLNEYGTTWLYDRTNNVLRELSRVDSLEKINMKDVHNIEREKGIKDKNFQESVIKNIEDKIATMDRKDQERSRLRDFLHNSIRTFSSWR